MLASIEDNPFGSVLSILIRTLFGINQYASLTSITFNYKSFKIINIINIKSATKSKKELIRFSISSLNVKKEHGLVL
jgi:hypothetical protein